jgi:DNA-binding NarL/FixJ family response regulator
MTSVPTALPVVVTRDPDSDTLRRQLARGPLVVVSDRPHLAAEIAAAADYAWALVPPDIGEAALQAVLGAVGAGFTVVPMALARVGQVSQVGRVTRVGQVTQVAQDDAPAPVERLTRRERDVLQCLAEGLANRAIARALGISEHTVKFHLASIFGKLGATTRTEAVRLGLRQGLVAI